MSRPDLVLGGMLLLSLYLYFLFGGADFGGGVWDLFARGPRRKEQRALVSDAIAPVWEVNHVWLIFAVVLLFSGFPRAFSALSVALHVPLTLFLLGVVLRGAAFAFRSADFKGDQDQRRWGRVFAWASLVSPVFLGMCVGALASGRIRVVDGVVEGGFYAPWLAPFPLVVGLLALAQCAYVAAIWLAFEAPDPALREDLRRRALGSGVVVGALALLGLVVSRSGAPRVFEALTERSWALGFHALTAAVAVGTLGCVFTRRWGWARAGVSAQVGLVLGGWVLAQYPYLVVPDLTLANAGGSATTQSVLAWTVVGGAPVLGPSLWLLFRIFKR